MASEKVITARGRKTREINRMIKEFVREGVDKITILDPMGIATQDPRLRRRLDVEVATRRIENLLKAMIKEMCMIAQLAGKTSPLNLEKEDLRALTVDASAITGVKLVGSESVVNGAKGYE